jgi:hypothetical protein
MVDGRHVGPQPIPGQSCFSDSPRRQRAVVVSDPAGIRGFRVPQEDQGAALLVHALHVRPPAVWGGCQPGDDAERGVV